MTIQILPENQSAAAGIGSGIGQGLAQQLPEEIKRYRLQSGLENLRNQPQGDIFKSISDLASIPGMDPSLLGILAPLIQQQGGANQFQNATGNAGSGVAQSNQNGIAPTQQNQPFQATPLNASGSTNRPIQSEKFDPTNTLTNKLLSTQRLNYQTAALAGAGATNILTTAGSDFDTGTKAYLQKDLNEQEKQISGVVRQQLKERMLQEIAENGGRNREQTTKRYVQKALDLDKSTEALKNINSNWGYTHLPDKDTVESIRHNANVFKKEKVPSDVSIDTIVSSQNISKAAASWLYDDLKGTPEGKVLYNAPDNLNVAQITKDILSGPKRESLSNISKKFGSAKTKSLGNQNPEAKLAKDLEPTIRSTTPMGSLAFIAEQKGYDGNKLLQELRKILPPENLTAQQIIDLQNQQMVPQIRSLDEYFLLGRTGEKRAIRK